MARRFLKMHGLGNDFVVLDARAEPLTLTPDQARRLADRREGVGCDQIILIEPPTDPKADAFMRFLNADGSESGACGNGSRCIGALLADELGRHDVAIQTTAGLLRAIRHPDGQVTVDMGPARLGWADIPLAEEMDTLHVPLRHGPLDDACCVSMGNPHAVFFVPDAQEIDLPTLGPVLEHHPLFPQRANIEVVTVLSPARIRMRVWERGSGITRACGTGACASLVAASRRGLTGRSATVVVDGGELLVDWADDGHVMLTGPVATSFAGEITP